MINVNVLRFSENHIIIDIEGHAGYKPKGEDLVCASVSILYYTLIHRLTDLQPKIFNYQESDGKINVEVWDEREEVKASIDTIIKGLALLNKHYGEYVNMN